MNERHKHRQMTQNNKILVVKVGSHMYGTNTPESDEDFVGIFMPSEEYVYGFKRMDEVDMSVHDKDENGRNTKEAIDIKYYEFRKFVKLAMENNPNIIEILFAPKENIIYVNEIGQRLLDMAERFPFQGLKQKFLGYAFSQKHKMIIKKDNYFDLIKAKDFLKRFEPSLALFEVAEEMDKSLFKRRENGITGKLDFYNVGDINLQPSVSIKNSIAMLDDRLAKVGNREDLYLKHAYDTKFAMHLVRLMIEGKMLLEKGVLTFPFEEETRNSLLEIRKGHFSVEFIMGLAEELERKIGEIKSPLPEKPRYDEIENFVITTMKEFLT